MSTRKGNIVQPKPQPQKVTEIVLCGKTFDLAKNGQFSIVRTVTGPDYYGKNVSQRVKPGELTAKQIQCLIDLLGQATQALQSHRDRITLSRGEEKE